MSELDLEKLKQWPTGKVGVVVIVGRPNVGKSTFLNSILDFHLCAVSKRPQTTRRNWRGILSNDESQIILIDTPGAHVGKTKLGEYMLEVVMDGLRDADIILCLADPSRECGEEDQLIAERAGTAGKKVFLLLNKADICSPEQCKETEDFYRKHMPEDCTVFEVSALKKDKLDAVLTKIREDLPTGPFFYEADEMTDAFTRDIGSELIREAALEILHKEVPHALAVEINDWKEGGKKLRVNATIHVERESQKGIVVGKEGSKLAEIRRNAIPGLADLAGQRVDLRLYVKVSKDWRNRKSFLRNLGLTEE